MAAGIARIYQEKASAEILLPALLQKLVAGKIKTYTGTSPPLFSKKAIPWGKKWPVQMNLPFFAVKAYVPGGGPESGRKKFEKCLPAGTGTKIYFASVGEFFFYFSQGNLENLVGNLEGFLRNFF